MINNSSSSCQNCMVLIRKITLYSLVHNIRVFAKYISMVDNSLSDSLSRFHTMRFWKLVQEKGLTMDKNPTLIPKELWPPEK